MSNNYFSVIMSINGKIISPVVPRVQQVTYLLLTFGDTILPIPGKGK